MLTDADASATLRVSCLMPVYNSARYLEEAIESILHQTLQNFELIIINDGSTDLTGEILDDYARKDPRIQIVHQANRGIVGALNAGLRLCRASYIARMDGDDVCLPHRFAFQTEYLDSNPDCVAVGGVFMGIDGAGTHDASYGFKRNRVTSLDVFPVRIALTLHPLMTIRREALLELGGYRATFPHAEDYDLFLRLKQFGTVDNPPELMIYYRNHEQSVSRRNIELQESAMGYAEFAAIELHRRQTDPISAGMDFNEARIKLDNIFPSCLVRAYIAFRIWRRLGMYEPETARSMRWSILASALTVKPTTLLLRDYWLLRQRMLGRLALNLLADLKTKVRERAR